MTDTFLVRRIERRAPGVLKIETQTLGVGQMVLGHFIEARQVFGDAVFEPEAAPEIAVGAIDQKQLGLLIDQQIAPFQVVMGKAMVMHGLGITRQLTADTIYPGTILEQRIMVVRQL